MRPAFIVGIGGTPNPASTTEAAMRVALESAARCGAVTKAFGGQYMAGLPLYLTPGSATAADELIAAVRQADGLIIASPGYHGSISGIVKNAIDYLELTARDTRVYLDSVPVGLVVTASGWQAMGSTLATMRSIVHALRGWPTPLGATINTSGGAFRDGVCVDEAASAQLALVGSQVATFAAMHVADPGTTVTGP
jgi:FMN reductase